MSSRKRHNRALRWTRYLSHYPEDVKATPACIRAFDEAHRGGYGHADDGSDNPYAGPYGALVLADMERLGLY